MKKILKKPYFGFFCHFWLYRSHHHIGNKNAVMKNVMKITRYDKILKKSHIWLKNEKGSCRKYETFAKLCHFWLF